jgi:hypothetical protein
VNEELDQLIRRADLDELVRHVDATCSARDWDHLVDIRDAARSAVSTGRQLWPIATLANYRLALWAPAEQAVRALDDTARTFMPGPVSEIIAVYHRWEDLDEHLADGHDRSLVAHERALRGDTINEYETSVLDLPFELQPWEPHYELASYNDDGVDFPAPELPTPNEHVNTESAEPINDPDTVTAFRRLVEAWTSQSNGSAQIAIVEGNLEQAIGALNITNPRIARITAQEALAQLAWAGASGGAHGKRRGTATGRSDAWWFLATFTGLADDWPCDVDDLGDVIESLDYYAFTHNDAPLTGWNLSLAIVDPDEGLAVAFHAHDQLE